MAQYPELHPVPNCCRIWSNSLKFRLRSIEKRASLNSSASHLFQTPPPFYDWLYADRLHAIDR
ncbi:hypothetical protein T02_2326 [Trichinella nativa]|uniref:Uncharacterized protein n=1 Tax=Trichinella nativa TaxID=6335 RepID=A0A0V1KKJ4_9BILA|nr:hypothetical protein T02_2326 [Trichinella nativa]